MSASGPYGSGTVKRTRRTGVELAEVDDAIVRAVVDEHPVTLRGVYYRAVSAGAVDKTEAATGWSAVSSSSCGAAAGCPTAGSPTGPG